jgi:hypothetical protein
MSSFLSSLTGGYKSNAKVIDGTLIVTLPDATTPVIWRMPLEQVNASAIEIRDAEDQSFKLVLKGAKGDTKEIAHYNNRAKAVRSLMAISRALEQASRYVQPMAQMSISQAPVTQVSEAQAPKKSRAKKTADATDGDNITNFVAAPVQTAVATPYIHNATPVYHTAPVATQPSIIKGLIGIALIFILLCVFVMLVLNMDGTTQQLAANSETASSQATGVAVSADDFLKNR